MILATWDDALFFSEGLAAVKTGGKWGFIDKSGKLVIPATWGEAEPFYEGLARVETGGKWGFVDKSGKLVIPAMWDDIILYEHMFTVVMEETFGGSLDSTGTGFVEIAP